MPVVVLFWLCGVSATAHANPALDEAASHYAAGDFAGALDAYERAETTALSRADLTQLLVGRALVHFALSEQDLFEQQLRRLAALEHDLDADESLPPDVRRAYQRIRDETTPLSLRIETIPAPGARVIRVRLAGNAELVRDTIVTTRAEGEPWTDHEGRVVRVASDARVELYVTVRGPGGAPIANEGSEREPRVLDALAAAAQPPRSSTDDDRSFLGSPVLWIAVGAVLVAGAVAAIAAVALGGGSSEPVVGNYDPGFITIR
jgi:hypothetical protein